VAHDVLIERDVMVEMRDGTRLATDVYRPTGAARHPVLVHRTPYDKSSGYTYRLVLNPVVAAARGYAVVVQDCRGRFASDGDWTPFVHEVDDGWDTLEWAAGQPWSNGDTAPYGSSGVGISALAAAGSGHESVKCCALYMVAVNPHEGMIYSGGAFELGNALHWSRSLASNRLARLPADDPSRTAWGEQLRRIQLELPEPVRRLPQDAEESFPVELAPFYRDWIRRPAYDAFWQGIDLGSRVASIRGPVLHISGWYDNLLRGHLDLNDRLREHPDPRVRAESRFVLGPWDHTSYYSQLPAFAGDRNFGPDAVSSPPALTQRFFEWFDRWLLSTGNGAVQPPVRYFMMGENAWRESERWPPAGSTLDLYLHSAGHANTAGGDGRLDATRPSEEPPDTFEYDPMDPVPSAGGRTLHKEFGDGPGVRDQRAVEARPDVLVFTTEPLDRDLRIAGPVRVELHAASSCDDTDFTAKLVDVEPSGYCAILAEGITRARYRSDRGRAEFLVPGEPALVPIDCWDVAHRFRAGHRVRLEISSSNFPRFDRNLNTRGTPARGRAADARRATQTVFHDDRRPSRLRLRVPA
jgi:uncharacterized protein